MPYDEWTEEGIVRGLRNDDPRALDVLVWRWYRPLLAFVLGYVESVEAAEDVLQELFIRVWKRRAALDPTTSLRSYLYAAARNVALNARERQLVRRRHEADSALAAGPPVDRHDVMAQVERDELGHAVRAAVASLSERGREVYLLSFQHGLSYREIAATLGISVPTVQTHIARAIATLGRKLRPFLVMMFLFHR